MKMAEQKLMKNLKAAVGDLQKAGAISKRTMRHFEDTYFPEQKHPGPADIRNLRFSENVSQAAFASHLGVSPGLISQWERGEKKPSGPSLKLLDLVARKGLEVLL